MITLRRDDFTIKMTRQELKLVYDFLHKASPPPSFFRDDGTREEGELKHIKTVMFKALEE